MRKELGAIVRLRFLLLGINSTGLAHAQKLVHAGWALDGRPIPGSQKFEFEQVQRDIGLKEPQRPEQVYDFSLLLESGKR